MVNYTYGERIKGLIEVSGISKGDKDAILGIERITYEEFSNVYKMHRGGDKKSIMHYMSDLTPVLDVYDTVKAEKAMKSEGYVKLMNRLRSEEQEREYRALLKKEDSSAGNGVDRIGNYSFMKDREGEGVNNSNASAAKEVKHQLTTIVNIMITVLSVGYAVWYWSGSSMGLSSSKNGNGVRILLSLVAALIVLVAEVVVFGGYLRKVEEARDKERKVVENRRVVETIVITGRSGKDGRAGQVSVVKRGGNIKGRSTE